MSSLRALAARCLLAPFRRRVKTVRNATRLAVERLEARENPAPVAAIQNLAAVGSTTMLLGDAVNYSFFFANTSPTDVGYTPFISVAVETSGPDGSTNVPAPPVTATAADGFGTPTVTAAGLTLTASGTPTVLTAGQTTYVNPVTGQTLAVPAGYGAGDTIYTYLLPFGSFSPNQSTQVTASVPSSRYADVGTPLRMSVLPGYRDSDGNPNAPLLPLNGATANTDATPELYRFRKVYLGPENETATGPNFVRRYRLEVDIATGQTLNALTLTDDLPPSMQIVGRTSARMAAFLAASGLSTNVFSAASSGGTAVTTSPDGTLTYAFGNVTGVDGLDAAFEFDFFVPRDTSGGPEVLPQTPSTGTDSVSDTNTARTAATWTPLDTRDAANQNVAKATPDNGPHTLQEHSLATQKTATLLDLTTGNPTTAVRPGQTLVRYDIDFQVSDYYAFNNVTLQDLLGDGHRLYLGTFGGGQSAMPTLQVSNAFSKGSPGGSRTDLAAAAFADPGSIVYRQLFTSNAASDPVGYSASGPASAVFNNLSPIALAPTNPYDGSTFLQFNISQELARRLPAGDGVLVGGEIGNDGSGPNNNAVGSQLFGGTTGRITFYALTTDEYSDIFQLANGGTGDPSVDQGDTIRNRVPLDASADAQAASGGAGFTGTRGDQLNPATVNTPNPTVIGVGTDDTAASLVVPRGTETKSVYAINNTIITPQTAAETVFSVQAGDRVTYKLTYDLPISRFEGLRLVDLPPLPVFRVGSAGQYTFDRTNDNSFTRYEIEVAPDDTFFSTFGTYPSPTITTDQIENSVTMDFGTFDDALDRSTRISLLITLPVGSDSFIDDLFLTNQLRIYEGSTVTGITTEEDLRRIELVRPQVGVDKGIVGFGNTGRTLGGHVFTAPNDPPTGASTPAFTGTIDTAGEADAVGGANAAASDGLDAGDRVRYAIVAQNTGRGDAFNVVIEDQIQPGYVIPPTFAGLNLNVRRGDGTLLSNFAEVQGFARVATTGALTGATFGTTAGGTFTNVTRAIDGMAMNLGDTVLVKDQGTSSQNGVYVVTAVDLAADTITLVRGTAFDTAGELSNAFIAVMAGTSADRYFQAGAVATLNTSVVNYTLQGTTQDYYVIYDATTGAFRLLLSDSYTAGNVNAVGQSLDDRSGGLSRGESVPSVFTGDTPTPTPITNGSNTVVVQYDLVLAANVAPNQTIVNTAVVTNLTTGEESGDLTDPAVVPGATQPSDTATAVVTVPQQTKTLIGTSHTAPGNVALNQATIGEFVTYELVLTIPEGATPGANVLDQLDEGLEFIDILTVMLSSNSLSSSTGLTFANNGAANTATLTPNTGLSGSNNRNVTFTFGTLTNSNLDNTTGETITIRYRARVRNVNTLPGDADGNQAGDLRNNSARFRWTNNATTIATVSANNVTVVESVLTNVKDVAVQAAGTGAYSAFGQSVRADAGDNIRYRITLANGNAATDTTAYDVSLSDQLPTGFFVSGAGAFTLVSVSTTGTGQVLRDGATHTLTLADLTLSGTGLLTLNSGFTYDIEPNVTITVVVEGVSFSGAAGVSVNNIADLRWTSLPGVVTGERTGVDGEGTGLNNYADADNAVIESPPVVRKTIVVTSEAHTTGSNMAVGEVARYRLVVSLPEGTTRNVQVQDVLPAGLAFLNDGTARWAFVSTGGNVIGSAGVTNVTGLGNPTVGTGGIDGNEATLATLTSAQILGLFNDNNISLTSAGAGSGEGAVFADGADVFFRFGDLSNTDNDADVEYVVLEFNALVLNAIGNQAGTTRDNAMAVLADVDNNGSAGYIDVVTDADGNGVGAGEATTVAADPSNNGSGTPALSTPVTVTVVEPNVTVAKTVIGATSGDPGDTITFDIVLTAGSGANTATAFDVALADVVPSGFETVAFVGGSLTSTGAVTGLGAVGVSGNTVTLGVGSMAPGATVTFRITATINDNGAAAPAPGSTVTNTAGVTWTGLPGGTSTSGNPTGSDTPGTADSGSGERTGADGVGGALNDYAATDPADVTLNSHSLSGQVYYDANNNGVRDVAEVLITDPTTFRLTGTDVAGNAVSIDVTTTTGLYSFTGLRAGTYTVIQLDQPTGYLDGRDSPGSSSPGTAFGGTGTAATDDRGTPQTPGRDADAITTVVIGGGANSKTGINYNFGELLPAQLGNLVFLDDNANGRQDGGTEAGINGVSVVLTGTDDTGRAVSVSTTTSGGGTYQFTGLRPGTYTASFGTTAGGTTYARSARDSAVATDATDSDGAPTTGTTGGYTLAAGQSDQTVDQGLFAPVSLGNRVYFDADRDGVQDAGEPGLAGVAIQVVWHGPDGNLGGGDDQTFTTTTGANGVWTVGNLPPGTFTVTSTPTGASGLNTLTDSLDNAGLSATNPVIVSTTSGVSRDDVDFGYVGTASLGDRVWLDLDSDGVQDAGEPGVPGLPVTLRWAGSDGLFNTADDAVLSTTTGLDGAYLFDRLPAGNFRVSVGTAGTNLAATYDLDSGTTAPDNTADTTLTAAQTRTDVDFGLIGNASLGDRVWYDADGDGVQDAGEPGIAGATVTATWFGIDGVFGGGDDVTFTVTTVADGTYLFTGLPANALSGSSPNYRVQSSAPAAFPTFTDSLSNGLLSPVNPVDVQVSPTEGDPLNDRRDVDFGYRGTAALGDRVWLDDDGNGRLDGGEAGVDGVTVELFFDANTNGTFEPGELVTPLVTTSTSGGGNYSFPNLAAGNYRVRFGNTAGGTTYGRTAADSPVAVDATDSDANTATGFTGDYTLASGNTNPTVDAGLYVPMTIGDTVWYDTNGDGTQNPAEVTLGVPGVVLVLDYAGPDGTFDGTGDVTGQATATTDASGNYSFTNLRPGTYRVRVQDATVPVPSLAYTTAGGNTQPSVTTSGVNDLARDFGVRGSGTVGDTVFLDVDNNGLPGPSEGLAGVRVLLSGDLDGDGTVEANETLTATTNASGQYLFTGLRTTPGGVPYTVTVDTTTVPQVGGVAPANTVDPNGGNDSTSAVSLTDATPNNLAQDFGYRNTAANSGSIGDTVFLDVDGDGAADAGEGITGVTVTLTADIDGNGTTETFTRVTDASGNYRFDGLPFTDQNGNAITYRVTLTTADLPAGVTNTTDPDGGADSTSTVQLSPANPVNLAQDFGYRGDGSIGDTVFLDLNNNGVADAGEGITGVTVVLTADVNGDGVQDLTVTATTGPDGEYLFDNLPVNDRTAAAITYTVRVTGGLPTGVSNTVDPDGTTDGVWAGTLATGPAAPDRRDIDFGYRGTGRLGDRVWLDTNGDGVQDATSREPSLPNVGFTLTYAGQNGTFGDADDITTTLTGDLNGVYTFDHLPAGTFRVTVNTATLPGNVSPTFDLDGTVSPHAADATLTTGQARTDVDFGYRGAAGLGDRVWLDQNRNGAQDPGEGGIPGAVVQLVLAGPDGLLNTADDLNLTATTGANGVYTLGGLPVYRPADDFRVTVLSLPASGLDAVGDLDSPVGSGDQTVFGGLGANQTRTDVDFGYAGRGRIAGVVFEDVNNDGVRQAGDPAIPGTVLVLDGTDVFGNPLRDPLTGGPLTATADANGEYGFTGLPPGTYRVREVQPAGFLDGTDTPGSLGGVLGADMVSQIVLPADGNSVQNNFAELRPARVAGTVYEDRNNNGRQDPSEPGIPGVRVVLNGTDDRGPVALTLTTDANGNFTFPDLRPGTYTLTQTQPVLFAQGQNTVGTGGGALGGIDVIQTIVLAPGQDAIEYRFGEIVRAVSAVPALPVETVLPWETSKRMFLSSTTSVGTASVPDFAALGGINTTRPIQFAATGDDAGGSRVRVYDLTNGRERFRFDPFPGFTGGVRTAVGDITGDGIPDVVAAAGPGGGPHVVIYDGDTGAVVQSFFAFEAAFRGGSFVATGDFDGDGTADLAVSADRGGGPRVRVFRSGNPLWVMSDFWGIEDANFRGGARVAAGDVNADGRTDLVVSAGFGGGPRVAVYDGRGLPTNTQPKLAGDFFAFEPTFFGGVYLASADVDGDGFAEVLAGAGEGGGPRVRTISGRELTAGRATTVTDQFVFDLNGNAGGARVAATDLDGDGRAELFVGTGPGVRPLARFFNPRTGTPLDTFSPQWENTINGVFVG